MKPLYTYFEDLTATPGNTMGMGNPIAPIGDQIGTEPIVTTKCKKEKYKKYKKKITESLKEGQYIFTVIKPGFLPLAQQIIERFEEEGFEVFKLKTKKLLLKEAQLLYKVHKNEKFYNDLCKYMVSDSTLAIIYSKSEPTKDIFKEVESIKDEIRKKYGESDMRNVLHSSDSFEHMNDEIGIYF